MTSSALIAFGSFIVCFVAAKRSLTLGLCAMLCVGYAYGITRANVPGTWSYLMFDFAVIGVYGAQLFRTLTREERARVHDLRLWMIVLIVWPALLFVLFLMFPSRNPTVELVGLRGNVFLLPFLLFGARLDDDDLKAFALCIAVLNIAAVAIGTYEFFFGIDRFYPLNETTELIFKSRDLLGHSAYRIPATFVNAHAFAGTLALTLPFLVGAWPQPQSRPWAGPVLTAAIACSFVGIFMAATRTHMITAALLAVVVTTTGGLTRRQWVRWLVGLVIVGYIVAGDARLQRFTTLGEEGVVSQRIGESVNYNFFDLAADHPFGSGLTSGGTSVPYFLRNQGTGGMVLESEYARITLEQGLPGLLLWGFFIVWVLTRRPGRVRDSWLLGRRLGWVACLSLFVSSGLGIGMMSSVPQTALMLLTIGWITTARRPQPVLEEEAEVAVAEDVPAWSRASRVMADG